MDILTKEQRHKNMSHIRAKNTKPELLLRKALWHWGLRYRKNYKMLPGSPDIAIIRYHIAVFVDGDFSGMPKGIRNIRENRLVPIRNTGRRS